MKVGEWFCPEGLRSNRELVGTKENKATTMSTLSQQPKRSRMIREFLLPALAFLSLPLLAGPGQKFYPDDPIATEPETQNATGAAPWKIDLFYDLMLNQFAHPGESARPRAMNVNTIDEVPDSSWFTNRILSRRVSLEEAVRGPLTSDGPVPGKWTVIRAKNEGAAPGFTIRDSAGVTWFIAFDPKSNPEGATGAAVVAMRIFWALGYFQAEYHISRLRREQLEIDPEAKFIPASGRQRSMTLHDIEPVLERGARDSDGSYRVLASRLLPGKILGGFKYYGTRPDDPNDVVPHEHRRELRALHVFGAWTNLVDIKAQNTMDTLITENGKSRVRHYLLDVGSTFGIGANGPHDYTEGYEYLFEGDKTLKRAASFGFYLQPWQTISYQEHPAIGRFEGTRFEPDAWKSRVPAAALLRSLDDDNFWAARRVAAFSDELIRAIVKAGKYSDPAAEKLLADVLIARRNKISQTYLTRINPVVAPVVHASGELTFANAAVDAGVASPPASYSVTWSALDNATGATKVIGETKSGSNRVPTPAGLTAAGNFVVADIRAGDAKYPSWSKPVRATFRRTSSGWGLVALEREIDAPGAPPK